MFLSIIGCSMGCGESKIKKINLTNEEDWDTKLEVSSNGSRAKDLWKGASDLITKQNGVISELITNVPVIDVIDSKNNWSGLDTRGVLPNSLLATIPSSDLGESLDCRPIRHNPDPGPTSRSAPVSATSLDSGDSGYDEYEDENAHIITEHSVKTLVDDVIQEFKPVDLPELLVITGRACTRILSGYEKTKKDEQNILASLRAEGLLAKPGGKAQGGISFEIVDMKAGDLKESFISTSSLLPGKKTKPIRAKERTCEEGRG